MGIFNAGRLLFQGALSSNAFRVLKLSLEAVRFPISLPSCWADFTPVSLL